MPNWASISERAALASPVFVSLSPASKYLLLDLLESYTDRWRWETFTDMEWDEVDAVIAQATLELLIEEQSGDMEFIQRFQGSSSVGFLISSIDTVYRHFHIKWAARSGESANFDSFYLRFNFDNGANYNYAMLRMLAGTAAMAGSIDQGENELVILGGIAGSTAPTSRHNSGFLDIINAQNNSGADKVIHGLGLGVRSGTDSTHEIRRYQGQWLNTSDDITAIEIATTSIEDFTSQSFFDLYGIR